MTKFSLLCIFCLAFSTWHQAALAAEPEKSRSVFEAVSPLSKGDRAPFEGILFSKDLAARIEAERKTMISLKLAEARAAAEIKIAVSKVQLKLDIANGKLQALEEKHKKISDINREQIDFLRENYMPKPWYEEAGFLVPLGIALGIGLAIGAAHIVKTVD